MGGWKLDGWGERGWWEGNLVGGVGNGEGGSSVGGVVRVELKLGGRGGENGRWVGPIISFFITVIFLSHIFISHIIALASARGQSSLPQPSFPPKNVLRCF